MLGTITKHLKSTGVYFSSPAPEASLPLLPGEHVKAVHSEAPVMVGEFLNDNGERYIIIVNLSLERSAKFDVETIIHDELMYSVSLGEDAPYLYDFEASKRTSLKAKTAWKPKSEQELNRGLWLPAGQGVMIKCTGKSRTY